MYVNAKLLVLFSIAVMFAGQGDVARSQINGGRAMLPEDLLTLQAIRETVFSPDGRWAAVVVERPKKAGESYERGYLRGLDRSDVWLASTDGKKVVNVTRGEAAHAGYWDPVWSPDSKRLAMASTRGSDNVRAYIYDLNTQHLRACTTDGLDLALRIEDPEHNASTMAWLDPDQLFLGVLPPSTRPLAMDENERSLGISVKAMADVKRGRGVTASILDTERIELPAAQRKNVILTVVDVATNRTRVVTRVPLIETRLSQRVVSISPDRRYAAILATDYPSSVSHDRRPGTDDISRLRIGVANLTRTDGAVAWVENARPASFGLGVIPTSIRWAPSASTFAFIGTAAGDPAPTVFTVKSEQIKTDAVAAFRHDQIGEDAVLLTAEDIQWTSSGELLVYGYAGAIASIQAEAALKDIRGFSRDNSQETAKREWWIISSPNSYHKLTPDLAQSPRVLFKTQNSKVMLGASGGQVWAIDTSSRTAKAVKATGSSPSSIVWPRQAEAHRPTDHVIVSQSTNSGSDLFRLDMSGSAPIKIGTMPRGVRFTDYSPHRQLIAYETEVTELRVVGNNRIEPVTLVSLNRQLDAIAKPQYRNIQYQTAEGKQLAGALLLPHGYVAGRRYPLIVSVYGGTLAPSRDWANAYEWRTRYYPDPLVLAGHGYAVLIPSIPLPPMGVQSDPMLELDKGVKPAVEKVVEMGIADPDRIGLVGYSYGGYGVYGLVTQTQRFKAAVAIVGATDLLSDYGLLDPRHRFSDVPNLLWGPYLLEAQQMRMGVPPWKDLDRYLRNSPYVHVDKVTTPLLMIHGELDTHPLSEPEKFFVALNRQGKRAKLVRYLAEGHSIDSPGNILDMYKHILNWFDEYLQNGQSNQSAKTK
jgi:dipeptidyl aminopeptidase/acylaminoacyl peptidase